MTIVNITPIRYVAIGFIAFGVGIIGYDIGRNYEGNARCRRDGIEEHFAIDFPGYIPHDSTKHKLLELKMVYISGKDLDFSISTTPVEKMDAAEKGLAAKRKVEKACKEDNHSY